MRKEEGKQTALIPMMVDDPKFSESGLDDALIERHEFTDDYFLGGPVTRRIALLDFDEKSGALLPGVPYEQPQGHTVRGHYKLPPDPVHPDPTTRAFNQVSAFATVFRNCPDV